MRNYVIYTSRKIFYCGLNQEGGRKLVGQEARMMDNVDRMRTPEGKNPTEKLILGHDLYY